MLIGARLLNTYSNTHSFEQGSGETGSDRAEHIVPLEMASRGGWLTVDAMSAVHKGTVIADRRMKPAL